VLRSSGRGRIVATPSEWARLPTDRRSPLVAVEHSAYYRGWSLEVPSAIDGCCAQQGSIAPRLALCSAQSRSKSRFLDLLMGLLPKREHSPPWGISEVSPRQWKSRHLPRQRPSGRGNPLFLGLSPLGFWRLGPFKELAPGAI